MVFLVSRGRGLARPAPLKGRAGSPILPLLQAWKPESLEASGIDARRLGGLPGLPGLSWLAGWLAWLAWLAGLKDAM